MYKLIVNPKCYRQIFNIGNSNNKLSVLDLATNVIELCSSNSKIVYDMTTRNSTDISNRVPCVNKIKSFINWEAKLNIDRIIVDMIKDRISEK